MKEQPESVFEKLGKVWKKINIWEVSACGIPMYPKAHKSYSLVKALQESEGLVSDELNEEEKPMEDSEEEKSEEDSGSESEETSEENPAEETPEAPAEAPEEKPEGEESEDVDKSAKVLQDAIVKGFRIAIKEAQTERGLISPEKSLQEKMGEELKKKSIGELAVMSGLFRAPQIIGATREFD